MEIIQLCENFSGLESGEIFKLPNNKMPIPIQIYTSNNFSGSIILEGTLSDQIEINNETALWSPISGAFWTESTIDALFAQVTHIRVRILDYICGSVFIRLGV